MKHKVEIYDWWNHASTIKEIEAKDYNQAVELATAYIHEMQSKDAKALYGTLYNIDNIEVIE